MITTNRTSKLEELIEKYEHLKKDIVPTEEKLNSELSDIRLQIIDRSRARTSFTGDPLKDLSIFKFGTQFKENYEQLVHLRDMLKKAEGQFVLVYDISFNLLVNELDETDRCYIPVHVAALGIIDGNPLDVGYEYDIAGDKYYLKLRFKHGAYIRELEEQEHGKLDKWLTIIPTFRKRGESYTEKSEPLTLVEPIEDYKSTDDYIRHLYTEGEWETPPIQKKPYWRIAPDKFDISKVKIGSSPVIDIYAKQEFPLKEYKVFSLYIGNEEVMKRLGMDLNKFDTVEKIYGELVSQREKSSHKSLIS